MGICRGVYPGADGTISGLERLDFVIPSQGQRDFVETSKEPLAPPGINLEATLPSRRRGDCLGFEVNTDPARALRCLDLGRKFIDNLFVNNDRQDAILKAIGKENISETAADNGSDAHLLK
jgi:hypothetical protein